MNTNQSYEQSKERIDQMENGFNLMMQQVEKLETAKREAQEEAATLKAEVIGVCNNLRSIFSLPYAHCAG